MPQVPTYDGAQVRRAGLQPPMQSTPDVSSGLQAAGRAFSQVADVADQVAQRDASEQAFNAHAKLQQDWLAFDADARTKYRGQNADQYKAEVEKWWSDAPAKYGADLNPMAKKMASRAMLQTQTQAIGSSLSYWNAEKDRATDEAAVAAKGSEAQFAITTGTPEAITVAKAKIAGINANTAQRKGWTPEQLAQENVRDVSLMHTSMVNKLMSTDTAAAQTYFDANKGEIMAPQQEALREKLTTVTAAADGDKKAGEVWQQFGPTKDGEAVQLDKMEAAIREAYANDPMRQKAAIAGVRERAQAFNAAEGERRAQNTNSAWAVYQQTRSLSAMQKSPAFLALPAGEQVKLTNEVTDRQHMLYVRGVEDQARAEALKAKQSFPAFLEYSNPTTLAGMSRQQVQALQPYLGNQLTDHLVQKWDTLQTRDAKIAASMDQQDFNHVADSLGLKPFANNKTEDEKRQLGELQYRVEQMIDQVQRATGKPMLREDKMTLMRREMATTVSQSTWLGMGSKETPVIAMTPDDVAKVKVPADQRERLVALLKAGYDKNPIPEYEPTEDNIRRLYLRTVSPAAAYIPKAK